MAFEDINDAVNSLTWQPGDVILDLYEVRPVVEGLPYAAEEKSCHRGGFGQVYKVYHRGWKEEMAMKVPLPEVFENKDQVVDFTRECEAWIDLGLHPHIVTCYYVRNLSGQPLVFAEYLSGGNLKEWVASGLIYGGGHSAALKRILDIAIQTARGLYYAHEKGLVHQDVKPANIMLTPEGQAKISDFGTARARAKAAAGTVSVNPGTILVSRGGMTPAYCSPEQSLGEKLTRRTDIWSWGLTVLEMFTGEVTWASGVAAAQALQAYLYHGGEAEEVPPMPRDLALLLERCFSSEQVRPQDFAQVSLELEQIYRNCSGSDYPRAKPKVAEDYADSLNNRALSMHDLGRTEEAERLWREALKHDPAHLAATYNLGLVEWRSARINDDVLVERLEGLRQGQPTARVAYLLAMVHAERQDYLNAFDLLKAASLVDGDNYDIETMQKYLKPYIFKDARCLRTFEGHTVRVNSVCMSTDGRYALSGGWDNTLKLWEVESGECLRTLEGHIDWVFSICLSPDARYALSGSGYRDESLKLWELKSGKCLRTFKGHKDGVYSVCLSTNGQYALSGSQDKTLKLWEVKSGKCLHTFKGHRAGVYSVCLSSDNRFALSGSSDRSLKLWDIKSNNFVLTFVGHTGIVTSVCLSTNGQYALSGSQDKTLKLWEVKSGKCLRTFEGHKDEVQAVCLSSDSRFALSGSRDKKLKLWEVESGKCLRTFEGHTNDVCSVFLSADNNYALTGSRDETLKLWMLPRNRLFFCQLETSRAVQTEVVLSEKMQFDNYLADARSALQIGETKKAHSLLLAARSIPGQMRNHQLLKLLADLYPHFRKRKYIDGWHLRTFEGHNNAITSVNMSANGLYALTGSQDATLKLWELGSGKCLRTFEGHTHTVYSVSLSADCRYALSGSMDVTLKLWEVESGRCLRTFKGHQGSVYSVNLSADGRYAISGSGAQHVGSGVNTIKLWELESGICLRTLEEHNGSVYSVSLSVNGQYALSGSEDRTIKLWKIESGKCLRTLKRHENNVTSVCLSADNRYALSSSLDNTLKLWELENGECLCDLVGHNDHVYSACLSDDGKYALSGSRDRTIKLWSVESGVCLRTFEGHFGAVRAVYFSPKGRYVLSGSDDKTLKLWELYWELDPTEGC